MLLWTPLGLWVALPQVAKTISLHPPTFVSPILLSNVANIENYPKCTVHIATVLLAAVGLIWSQLLEAGRRASLDPDKVDTQLAGRFAGAFAWRDAKSMNVWTSFDCFEALVWILLVLTGWPPTYRLREATHKIGLVVLIILAIPLALFIMKRALALVTYTQGENMPDWVRATATPLLGKGMCVMLALLILNAQSIMANPYPANPCHSPHWEGCQPLDWTLTKVLYTVIDAGNYSAIKCHDEDTFDIFVSGWQQTKFDGGSDMMERVNCSQPLCGYRTWEDLCHAWRVAPLAMSTPTMVIEMNIIIVYFFAVGIGLAGNEHIRSGNYGKLAPYTVLILLLVLCLCIIFLWDLCLTLLQLPMLMLGLPAANPHAMASRINDPYLSIWIGLVALALLPIDTLGRFVQSRTNRGRSYFISYKQDDGNDGAVQMLANLLSAGGAKVWLDKLAEDRSEKGMVKGVQTSDVFVAVISKSYFASRFCCLEMCTALRAGKPVLVVWNQSKHTVQAALGWLPGELSFLMDNELLPIQEDIQMAGTCTFRITAIAVKPQAPHALNQIGEHVFESVEQEPDVLDLNA